MDRKRAKELLPIIEAYSEGKDIQYKVGNSPWVLDEYFDPFAAGLGRLEYRIKPEPREFWIKATAPNLHIGALIRNVPTTDDGWIKVREVL